ncbi:hypothetical protein M422DRAFT_37450 [Sphaerobolus stellatus SS14]|uniref:Aldehyde dehydrogenase domain-containing protein n=1 Tax=Sphaerobolus stellatus (strain SS14) TaxID=990650 RepID=A0A0C9U1W9_SPHS4|nr:hypothetical protein M422DRAFT_37450 [Sphaerobolus stellatus SS14]
MPIPFTQLFVNGQYVPAGNGNTFEIQNPSSGKIVGKAAAASFEDCKAAIDAAHQALQIWEGTPPHMRRDIFLKAADLVSADKYKIKIIQTMHTEVAAVDSWGFLNWAVCANYLREVAGFVNQLGSTTQESSVLPGTKLLVNRKPVGVGLAMAPWSAPVWLTLRSVALAILCGNTMILKASEYSPQSMAIIVELFVEAGLPAGVLNYITVKAEDSPLLVSQIIAHADVRHINFTGGHRVGRIIATEGTKYLKPCIFELGGKAPMIVMDDADVASAAKVAGFSVLWNSGQACCGTERLIVQKGIADQFIAGLIEFCKVMKAGNQDADPSANLGPLLTEKAAENAAGAEVILGDLSQEGSFIQPHLVKGVQPGMTLWDKESFGPVAAISVVDTVDEAIQLANSSDYSLAAALWTSDIHRSLDIASRIRSGYTNINGSTIHEEPAFPFVGLGGSSGYGEFDVAHFTQKRRVVIHAGINPFFA